jgi:hypothetical protein
MGFAYQGAYLGADIVHALQNVGRTLSQDLTGRGERNAALFTDQQRRAHAFFKQ